MISRVRGLSVMVRATFKETVQEPICLLLTLCAVGLTLVLPLVRLHQFGEAGRMARDGGLAFMLVFGLILAAITAGRTMAQEIESGTAAALLAKPVSRDAFVVAKFFGVSGVVGVFWLACLLATLLAERISEHFLFERQAVGHFMDTRTAMLTVGAVGIGLLVAAVRSFRGRRFGATALPGVVVALCAAVLFAGLYDTAGRWGGYSLRLNLRVVPAAILVGLLLMVYAAIAVALTTRLSAGPAVVICLILLGAGLLAEQAVQAGGVWGGPARLMPNVQAFWRVDALGQGGRIAAAEVGRVALYAACCCALALTIGSWTFKHRDMG